MNVKLEPAGRFAWEGQTVHYVVKADDATELAVAGEVPEGLKARISNVRQVGNGVEADLAVEVGQGAFAWTGVPIEARGASGSVAQNHFGIMAVPNCMMGGMGIVGALALAIAVFAIRRGGGLGWTFGILAALFAIAGLGFLAFAVWGRYSGMPWNFAPTVQ